MTDTTVTFRDKNGHFEVTVKSTFLEKCPNPGELDQNELANTFKYHEFLHNPFGPALRCLIPGKEKTIVYALEGKFIADEKIIASITAKKQHTDVFNKLIE